MTTITTASAVRIADVRKRIAAADDLYDLDRDTLDTQGWIELITAANGIREAEHTLARLLGERPTREYRNEYGEVTTDPAVAEAWSDAALETDYRDPRLADADWRPWNYEGTEAVTADRIAHYAAREAAIEAPREGA